MLHNTQLIMDAKTGIKKSQKCLRTALLKTVLMSCCHFQHLSLQSCTVVSPRVMSKGLQGHRDKSFISRDRPHHAERHTTSSSETHPGFISREPHHHKHTRSGAYTQWCTVDRHASSEPEHVHTEQRSRRKEGQPNEGEAENNNSTEAVQVVGW